jgi:adenosylcobyric acid synthase
VGLGLLPLRVKFGRDKRTTQIEARHAGPHWLAAEGDVLGYEIHMGIVERLDGARGAFAVQQRNGAAIDDMHGAISADGVVVGTMIHGLFENTRLRRALVSMLRRERGWSELAPADTGEGELDEYDRLAEWIRANVRSDLLHGLVGV